MLTPETEQETIKTKKRGGWEGTEEEDVELEEGIREEMTVEGARK